MKFASIGTRVPSASKITESNGGFTLIEALVALTLLVSFAGALTPLMFQGHRILLQGGGAAQAEIFLKSLLDTPLDRANPSMGFHDGQSGALHWRMMIEPYAGILPDEDAKPADPKKPVRHWALLHIRAQVSWGGGKQVDGETLRLAEFN